MNKLLAGAVALCVAVPSVFAEWDYFPVIEQGSVEANINSGFGIKVRYGLMENLEIFSANYADVPAGYTIGARYQIAPDMLSAFADLGIPSSSGGTWGITPGVQFSTSFTETISLGAGLKLPVHLTHPGWQNADDPTEADNPNRDGFGLDLAVGLELDIAFSEQVTFWVGIDFLYDNLTSAGYNDTTNKRPDFEAKSALSPALGFTFSKDNLSVGTKLGINLAATNDKGEDAIALEGGVDFGIKF